MTKFYIYMGGARPASQRASKMFSQNAALKLSNVRASQYTQKYIQNMDAKNKDPMGLRAL
jgi:hypothetical protein